MIRVLLALYPVLFIFSILTVPIYCIIYVNYISAFYFSLDERGSFDIISSCCAVVYREISYWIEA